MLEELGLDYETKVLEIANDGCKVPWFVKINPNGRIPALKDHDNDLDVFESGAIMWYLCEKFDAEGKLLPKSLEKRTEVNCWLMFQMGGLGPMQGQAHHFIKYAPEDVPYGKKRYLNETKRLYSVLESRLKDNEWLAAGQFSLADIANASWVTCYPILQSEGFTIDDFPAVKKWWKKCLARPGVKKGLNVPNKNQFLPEDKES